MHTVYRKTLFLKSQSFFLFADICFILGLNFTLLFQTRYHILAIPKNKRKENLNQGQN